MTSRTDPPRAADLLARRLYDAGCRHAFGMPGGEVLTLVDALEAVGIQVVLVKHENAGGFMAEGVYHRTGAPAIVLATLGPGALNAVNVVANAEQDRVPMIVLTGCVDPDEAATYTHQVLDHRAVFAPVTKASFTLSAATAGVTADKAVAIATEGRPGPVHIDVPISVADQRVENAAAPRRVAATLAVPAPGRDLETARHWLVHARRPVMIVGLDAMNEGAGDAVTRFAEAWKIPVITTYKAKGLIHEDHPLSLGGAGLSPRADSFLLPFVQKADLILCVGYDPIEMRVGWRDVWNTETQQVIDITAAPNHHYMHQAGLSFIAGCAETLTALAEGQMPTHDTWVGGTVETLRSDLAAAFPSGDDWGPAAVIDECRSTLPRTTLATADSGAHRILLSQMWRCDEPRGLVQSSGLCTMGCAVPLAMGLSLAEPDRPVISFSGDAGFLMVAGELATAAEMGLKPIFLVFVDASLALIELKQRQRQLTNKAVDFTAPDFAAIGRAFGGAGVTVSNRAELRDALTAAQMADTFTVIGALIERGAYDGRI